MEFGLVLGGGGARGLAHVGVWQVLEDAGLRPSVVAGTSMGGLVGAFIAAGYTGAEIERVALSVSWRRLLDLRPGPGLISGAGFLEIVFNWPGLTPLQLTALNNQDIYILMAVTALGTLLFMIGNLLSDLLLAAVDPRIRYS